MAPLTVTDHDRKAAGLLYVYPVVSRRAGGLSIGINLNPNNACNWRCIYCQVPDLQRGRAPEIDLERLTGELRHFLAEVIDGDFLQRELPEGMRRLNDIAFSGNGEPTSVENFAAVAERVTGVMQEAGLLGKIRLVLITNGSQMQREHVRQGLRIMAAANGEVWFKMDRATPAGIRQANSVHLDPATHLQRLLDCAGLCPVWVQSCWFELDGKTPDDIEQEAFLRWLENAQQLAGKSLRGVLLYGVARSSMQAEAPRLGRLPADWLESLAARIRLLGLDVRVSP